MRKALNENPMVQLAVLGIAAVAFAFILFTTVLKSDEPAAEPTADDTPTATAAPADSTAAPADSTESPTAITPTETPAPTAETPAVTPPETSDGGSVSDGLLPSEGLPRDLLVAFAKNKTIALLVVDPNGTSDKKVESYTEALRKRDDVEVFIVDVRDIADYSRVTAGVNVSRVPALIVVRPRKLTGSVPTASVSYGFRGARSVNQAIDDAVYKGKQVSAYP